MVSPGHPSSVLPCGCVGQYHCGTDCQPPDVCLGSGRSWCGACPQAPFPPDAPVQLALARRRRALIRLRRLILSNASDAEVSEAITRLTIAQVFADRAEQAGLPYRFILTHEGNRLIAALDAELAYAQGELEDGRIAGVA